MSRAVPFAILGSLLLVACSGGSDDGTSTTSTTAPAVEVSVTTEAPIATAVPVTITTVPLVFDGATVIVANGNIVGGIAFYANDNQNSTEYNGIQSRANGAAGFTDLCFYSKTGSYASNTPDMKIDKDGAITILSLAGSGSRTVVADANGLITAP